MNSMYKLQKHLNLVRCSIAVVLMMEIFKNKDCERELIKIFHWKNFLDGPFSYLGK